MEKGCVDGVFKQEVVMTTFWTNREKEGPEAPVGRAGGGGDGCSMVFKGENALRWGVDGRAKDWWRAGRKLIFWM